MELTGIFNESFTLEFGLSQKNGRFMGTEKDLNDSYLFPKFKNVSNKNKGRA